MCEQDVRHVAGETTTPGKTERFPVMKAIEEALRNLKFGQVTLTVQDGLVVQIDRTEKRRLV